MFRQNTSLAVSDEASSSRQFVTSLARGFAVLQVFTADDNGLSNTEIANRTGLPKPTVSRLTFTLLALGYLEIDEDTGRYSIHPHILTLGYPVLQKLSIRELARPYMRELADACHATVAIGIRSGLNMIVIERARHKSMHSAPVDIGVARPMATTAMGRACLAGMKQKERDVLLSELQVSDPKNWDSLKTGISDNIQCFLERGFCYSHGDWNPDYVSVGVPLILSNNNIISFVCGGYRARFTDAQIDNMAERLISMVTEISRISGKGAAFG